MVDSSTGDNEKISDLDSEDLSLLPLTPPNRGQGGFDKESDEVSPELAQGSGTLSPWVLRLRYKRDILQHEQAYQQLLSQPLRSRLTAQRDHYQDLSLADTLHYSEILTTVHRAGQDAVEGHIGSSANAGLRDGYGKPPSSSSDSLQAQDSEGESGKCFSYPILTPAVFHPHPRDV